MLNLTRQELMHELVVNHRIRSVADYTEQIVAEALNGTRQRNGITKGFEHRRAGQRADTAAPGLY